MARTLPSLQSRESPLASPAEQLRTLGRVELPHEFDDALKTAGLHPLRAQTVSTLQVNVGKLCNQTCRHCHVDAGPDRREMMTRETFEQCLAALENSPIPVVDITGGAPELNPHFRWFVSECRKLGRHVIDRCNLTVLELEPQQRLAEFLAAHDVEIVCSLPHYRPANTDAQRGDGVYEKSVAALKRLNRLGYGHGEPKHRLVLVTNPVGAFLPPAQGSIEGEWKRELARLHGITFDALYCLTDMPISRYLEWLLESGNLEGYLVKLVSSFNPAAAAGVMCRSLISVRWDGTLYDCDFNQMLELGLKTPRHIRDFDLAALAAREIATGRHCFGCTAGAGSSCGGATVK